MPASAANADRRIAAGIFLLVLGTYAYFFGGVGWNQNSHFDLTRALVERRTLHIDGYSVNTGDISRGHDGRTYSNKAPGLSFIAAVPYAIVHFVETQLALSPSELELENQWIVSASVSGVSGALIGVAIFLYGRRQMNAAATVPVLAALAVVFGTIVFSYSTMLMAHVVSALFLLLAVMLLRARPAVAGAAIGIATTCFYICAIAAAALAVIAWRMLGWRAAARFILGGLPFAALLAVYHAVCFGSPWITTVEAGTFTGSGLLFGVLQMPSLEALWGVTFSPFRGLFYTSPILLFAVAGLWFMRRNKVLRLELVAIVTVSAIFIVTIAAFNFWDGGWAFGPRYLVSIIPLLGIGLIAAADRWRAPFVVVGVLSLFINFIAAAVNPTPTNDLREPLRDELLPVFFTGRLPEKILRERNWHQLGPGDPVVGRAGGGANAGEFFFGEGTRLSTLPAFLWIVGGSSLLLIFARRVDSISSDATS